jgi:hypothetical protein
VLLSLFVGNGESGGTRPGDLGGRKPQQLLGLIDIDEDVNRWLEYIAR